MKAIVLGLPSLRAGKLRLNDVTIVFGVPFSMSSRCHWPMQGPQAFASTVAPIDSRSASSPSRSIVARTCSDPGVMSSGERTVIPCAEACRATCAARPMSSYDELVHDPTRATEISSGYPSVRAAAATSEIGRSRSGVCGPTRCGSSAERSISMTRS